jgi:chemotaxis protein histidine kinase CheA
LRHVFSSGTLSSTGQLAENYVVIVGSAHERAALGVDRLIGEQEVDIKSLSRCCGDTKGVSGATILGIEALR